MQQRIEVQAEEAQEITQQYPTIATFIFAGYSDGKVSWNFPTFCLSLHGICPGKCQTESFESIHSLQFTIPAASTTKNSPYHSGQCEILRLIYPLKCNHQRPLHSLWDW